MRLWSIIHKTVVGLTKGSLKQLLIDTEHSQYTVGLQPFSGNATRTRTLIAIASFCMCKSTETHTINTHTISSFCLYLQPHI